MFMAENGILGAGPRPAPGEEDKDLINASREPITAVPGASVFGHADAFVIGGVHSGYTSGPYMAKLLAQRILGQEPEMPLFEPDRLLALP